MRHNDGVEARDSLGCLWPAIIVAAWTVIVAVLVMRLRG